MPLDPNYERERVTNEIDRLSQLGYRKSISDILLHYPHPHEAVDACLKYEFLRNIIYTTNLFSGCWAA